MTTPIILGLTGLAGAGKTTVAEYLQAKHGFAVLNFADPLKEMVRKLDPIIGIQDYVQGAGELAGSAPIHLSEFLDDDGHFLEVTPETFVKSTFPEYRRVLQTLGTECIRGVDPGFWVDLMRGRIMDMELDQKVTRFVIADVRLENEAGLIKEMGLPEYGYDTHLVEVRGGQAYANGAGHVTEQLAGRLGEDRVLDNTGSRMQLALAIEEMLEEIL